MYTLSGGTENCVEGHHGTSVDDCGMGWTGGTENCVEGHHGTTLDVPYVYWGLRDGMDRWVRELC